MINSDLISMYVDNFINNTSHFQINDARQLPIVIPSYELINRIVRITSSAITSKQKIQQNTSQEIAQIQEHLDYIVKQIYGIK